MDDRRTKTCGLVVMSVNIDELLQGIESNPLGSRSAFLEVIDVLRKDPDNLEKALKLREQFHSLFLPNSSFWLDWLSDAKEKQPSDVESIKALYLQALEDCPHCSIALGYVSFMTESYDEDLTTAGEVRAAFDHALSLCGSDIVTGSELFSRYIDFELEEHETVVEELESCTLPENRTQAQEAVSRSKQRFIRLFHRQAALPLVGNEQQCLARFHQVLGELCVASDVRLIEPDSFQRKYSAGLASRESRLTFEVHINSEAFASSVDVSSRLASWRAYIAFEVTAKEMGRAQRLYERAVLDCPQSGSLWLDYAEFAFAQLRNHRLVLSVTGRALRALRGSQSSNSSRSITSLLWKLRLTSLECVEQAAVTQSGGGGGVAVTAVSDAVDAEIQRAISEGELDSAQTLLDLLLLSCEVALRTVRDTVRGITSGSSSSGSQQKAHHLSPVLQSQSSAAMNRLTASFEYAEVCLAQWFPHWEEAHLMLYTMWADAEGQCEPYSDYCTAARAEATAAATASGSKARAAAGAGGAATTPFRGSEVWERAVHGHPQSLSLFAGYVRWCKSRLAVVTSYQQQEQQQQSGAVDFTRRLLKRFYNAKYTSSSSGSGDATAAAAAAESLQREEWLQFERQWGGLEDLQAVMVKTLPAAKKLALAASAEEHTANSNNNSSNSNVATAASSGAISKESGKTGKKRSNEATHSSSSNNNSSNRVTSSTSTATAAVEGEERHKRTRREAGEAEPGTTTATTATTNVAASGGGSSLVVLHVGNFPFTASAEEMNKHIQAVLSSSHSDDSSGNSGNSGGLKLQSVELVLSKSGTSRGIAAVTLSTASSSGGSSEGGYDATAEAIRLLSGSEYADRHLTASVAPTTTASATSAASHSHPPHAHPVKVSPAAAGSLAAPHLTTVYVSRLTGGENSDQLREHFSQCGEVLCAKVSLDKKTGQSKQCGLVQFTSEEGRSAALRLHKTQWNGHEILVAPSRFSLVSVASTATAAAVGESSEVMAVETPSTAASEAAAKVTHSMAAPAALKPRSVVSFKPRNVGKPK